MSRRSFGRNAADCVRVFWLRPRRTGAMQITGPLVLIEGASTVLLADSAELREGLRLGLIRSARVVMEQQLQIAANTVERRSERFTEMNNVIASACEICPDTETPLWEMRADRVVHDAEERQLYFEGAQFRMFGLPVAYIPRCAWPDSPSLERATGFLSPRFSLDTEHGFGLRAPYFSSPLSSDKDLTLTPFLGTKGTYALEARYRQAFSSGLLELGRAGRGEIPSAMANCAAWYMPRVISRSRAGIALASILSSHPIAACWKITTKASHA